MIEFCSVCGKPTDEFFPSMFGPACVLCAAAHAKTQGHAPLFEQHASATIARATGIYAGRGTEYGDTWRACNFLKMKAVAIALGCEIKPEHFRAIATAAFCDFKYWRFLGGYKDDSLIDGINYDAFLAEEMRQLEKAPQETPIRNAAGQVVAMVKDS